MLRKYRLGIIGFGHMHINNVAQLYAAHPQVEWVGCADTVPIRPELRVARYTREWNRQNLVSKLGIPAVYEDYRRFLDEAKPDIVIVTCENAQHPDVVEACAAASAHVCVEKPMACSLSDALRMARACHMAGTTMIVNWPATWSPALRQAKALIDQGVIGRVLEVRYRAGHNGPLGAGVGHAGVNEAAAPMTGPEKGATWWHQKAAGGGATLDFCSYGAMFSRWVIGEPATAAIGLRANLNSHYGDADDNGILVVRFPSAMALLEGTWIVRDHGVPTGPIVYGSEGTLVIERQGEEQVVRVSRGGDEGTIYTPEPLPDGRTNVAEELIHHLDTGAPPHPTLTTENNLEYMAILDAGLRACESGTLELVDNETWRIG
ncbi:MAG: Gfo/Idh/MocA family oxidoreductase [Chloroflexi bacterium]|nr:Gfo/Idh/MocA family oxidoreductase [Chloroflexota bacterium]